MRRTPSKIYDHFPIYRRSDNKPEFVEKTVKRCFVKNGSNTAHIKCSGPRVTRAPCRASQQPDSVTCIATLTPEVYSCFYKFVGYERGDLNHVAPTAKIY